ncbi:MAG: hypothetical protein WAN13_19300, partial [Candidatus Acidiferrales bacterium]
RAGRQAGRIRADFVARFEIQIREMPVRLPTDPTVACRGFLLGPRVRLALRFDSANVQLMRYN